MLWKEWLVDDFTFVHANGIKCFKNCLEGVFSSAPTIMSEKTIFHEMASSASIMFSVFIFHFYVFSHICNEKQKKKY